MSTRQKELEEQYPDKNNTRRDFLKYSSLLGSAALLSNPVLAMAAGETGGMQAGVNLRELRLNRKAWAMAEPEDRPCPLSNLKR